MGFGGLHLRVSQQLSRTLQAKGNALSPTSNTGTTSAFQTFVILSSAPTSIRDLHTYPVLFLLDHHPSSRKPSPNIALHSRLHRFR
ncbi:hypothetical protein DACRYDRAFT_22559 [Dacryopinax primogenitus]|uniref:Uncharacterized protein n=1 Tax=Dacryopinax primogenitus (strain DJM 731) TaxID=1858805 RepID=M5GBN1_DACPD|nr:uncharacterized protein DACRYDRAFT_22559 [Dacryopinax primogenitus]EJU01418.1 hypothetical protein DACRYDRAFT_22559 [Dacryopinax primogenitus]